MNTCPVIFEVLLLWRGFGKKQNSARRVRGGLQFRSVRGVLLRTSSWCWIFLAFMMVNYYCPFFSLAMAYL
jgi:hypothetical protein